MLVHIELCTSYFDLDIHKSFIKGLNVLGNIMPQTRSEVDSTIIEKLHRTVFTSKASSTIYTLKKATQFVFSVQIGQVREIVYVSWSGHVRHKTM